MKKLRFLSALLVVASISALNSCKKEIAQTDNSAAATSSNILSNNAVSSGTQFGADAQGTISQKVIVYNKFGVKYVSCVVELKSFKGNAGAAKSLAQKGFNVILTINWGNPTG